MSEANVQADSFLVGSVQPSFEGIRPSLKDWKNALFLFATEIGCTLIPATTDADLITEDVQEQHIVESEDDLSLKLFGRYKTSTTTITETSPAKPTSDFKGSGFRIGERRSPYFYNHIFMYRAKREEHRSKWSFVRLRLVSKTMGIDEASQWALFDPRLEAATRFELAHILSETYPLLPNLHLRAAETVPIDAENNDALLLDELSREHYHLSQADQMLGKSDTQISAAHAIVRLRALVEVMNENSSELEKLSNFIGSPACQKRKALLQHLTVLTAHIPKTFIPESPRTTSVQQAPLRHQLQTEFKKHFVRPRAAAVAVEADLPLVSRTALLDALKQCLWDGYNFAAGNFRERLRMMESTMAFLQYAAEVQLPDLLYVLMSDATVTHPERVNSNTTWLTHILASPQFVVGGEHVILSLLIQKCAANNPFNVIVSEAPAAKDIMQSVLKDTMTQVMNKCVSALKSLPEDVRSAEAREAKVALADACIRNDEATSKDVFAEVLQFQLGSRRLMQTLAHTAGHYNSVTCMKALLLKQDPLPVLAAQSRQKFTTLHLAAFLPRPILFLYLLDMLMTSLYSARSDLPQRAAQVLKILDHADFHGRTAQQRVEECHMNDGKDDMDLQELRQLPEVVRYCEAKRKRWSDVIFRMEVLHAVAMQLSSGAQKLGSWDFPALPDGEVCPLLDSICSHSSEALIGHMKIQAIQTHCFAEICTCAKFMPLDRRPQVTYEQTYNRSDMRTRVETATSRTDTPPSAMLPLLELCALDRHSVVKAFENAESSVLSKDSERNDLPVHLMLFFGHHHAVGPALAKIQESGEKSGQGSFVSESVTEQLYMHNNFNVLHVAARRCDPLGAVLVLRYFIEKAKQPPEKCAYNPWETVSEMCLQVSKPCTVPTVHDCKPPEARLCAVDDFAKYWDEGDRALFHAALCVLDKVKKYREIVGAVFDARKVKAWARYCGGKTGGGEDAVVPAAGLYE
eukprot:TRINITY_DN78_c0_g1_i1.p1 TRINITY_DN78_c0_g1~~TRINITY_DN78_c0_g1_i1.p1  ORF type:complete len:972 (-),score=159.32 TRINITY_DN78_c0_g1_i1:1322-4237(-)